MAKDKITDSFKILSYEEESKLSLEEKRLYYSALKEYLLKSRYTQFNKAHINLASKLNENIVRSIINKIKGYDLIIDGLENIPDGPVIYASTHQDYSDHFNVVLSVPEHAIILNTNTVTKFFKLLMWVNGIIYVDRNDFNSRFSAKIELMKCLAKGKSIVIFPEGTYNCSSNKLHLPLHKGVIDMARKMNVPIIPMIQEYRYDESNPTIKNVVFCHVRFGKPVNVNLTDDTNLKLVELSTAFSSIRYDLIAEKGVFNPTNKEYINYVLSRIDGWSKINVSIDDERKTIYGVQDDFYLFNHVNDISFDEQGNLLETPFVQNLNEIYQHHLGNFILDRDGKLIDTNKLISLCRKKL